MMSPTCTFIHFSLISLFWKKENKLCLHINHIILITTSCNTQGVWVICFYLTQHKLWAHPCWAWYWHILNMMRDHQENYFKNRNLRHHSSSHSLCVWSRNMRTGQNNRKNRLMRLQLRPVVIDMFCQSQSLLYCQFCHMYRTYIQRIEIALLSYSLVHTDNTKH